MTEIPIAELERKAPSRGPLYHACGEPLLLHGESWQAPLLSILQTLKLSATLYVPDELELPEEVQAALQQESLSVRELREGEVADQEILERDRLVLVAKGATIPTGLRNILLQRGVQRVFTRKQFSLELLQEAKHARDQISNVLYPPQLSSHLNFADMRKLLEQIALPRADTDDFLPHRMLARTGPGFEVTFHNAGDPFANFVRDTHEHRASEGDKTELPALMQECLVLCQEVYNWFANPSRSDLDTAPILHNLNQISSSLMAGVTQNKDIMGLCSFHVDSPEYLPAHSLAVAVVSTLTAIRMQMGVAQVKAMVYGAVLADIGLLRMPKILMQKKGALEIFEKAMIQRHPILGLEMAGQLAMLPAEVPWILYQSHERSDGSGYPHKRKGREIHPMAQIVSLADTFVALCTARPYRSALLPYKAMEVLLQMASRREYEPELVRALLEAQSLFPVGSLVLLNDGRIAQVLSSNPSSISRPIVLCLSDIQGKLLSGQGERISLLDRQDLAIAKALPLLAKERFLQKLEGF